MLGWQLSATDYDGMAMGAAYQQDVPDDILGCGVPYSAGKYWFRDSPTKPTWPWSPTLTLLGPLGQSLAGVVVTVNLLGPSTCVMERSTTNKDGVARFSIPYPQGTGWYTLSGAARLGPIELARLGVSEASPLLRIPVPLVAAPVFAAGPGCYPLPEPGGGLICWLLGR